MTLLVNRKIAGAASHALVIGVGYYRHLPGGEGPFLKNTLGLAQLKAPVQSAREVVDFLAQEYRRNSAPLATIDLLLSPTAKMNCLDGRSVDVESATMSNVKKAIWRWHRQCNTSADNVAIFYFCGHGIERDAQYLLMEDFGETEEGLLDNTLNLIRFHQGMAQCLAHTQLFFVDACREVPRELKQFVRGDGQPVLDARLDGNLCRDAPILWAAAQGRRAFARKGESTQFTKALLQALRGGAAAQDVANPGRWSVRYNDLASAVGQLLRNRRSGAPVQEVRTGGQAGDALIHELNGPPNVPVVVQCDPETCAEIATLGLASLRGGQDYSRQPAPGAWQLEAMADWYTLRADLQAPYSATEQMITVAPPFRLFTVKVQQ